MTSDPTNDETVETPAWRRRAGFCLTGVLAVAAVVTMGYWGIQGLGAADTEALESPLMMSVARQLISGPGLLYGPYGGKNPLVLIHAPLYYRLAALTAWPLSRIGAPPVDAARIAGRLISIMGLLATLALVYRLARLGGGSRLAGWWAVLLVAGAPVLAGSPVSVRPDMLGVALQTAGLLLVLSAVRGGRGSGWRIIGAYVAFGLAICVKQHMVVEAAVGTALLVLNRRASAVPPAAVARGLVAAGAIVIVVYGADWVITQGGIWDAAFVAAGEVTRVYPGGKRHATFILYGLIRRSAGFLAMLPMIGLTMAGIPRGVFRKILVIAGVGVAGVSLANSAFLAFTGRHDLEVAGFFADLLSGPIFFLCATSGRSTLLGNRIDGVLWACLAGELALVLFLAYLSTGSWLNYGIQGTVLLAVLTARAGSRVLEFVPSARNVWPMALGILAFVFASYAHVADAELQSRLDRGALEKIFEHLKIPRSAFYFTDRPGINRLNGRLDLVYDHWLYRVFESAHLADPRSGWLVAILARRDVRVIVTTSGQPELEGTGLLLKNLGFRPEVSSGPYFVWVR